MPCRQKTPPEVLTTTQPFCSLRNRLPATLPSTPQHISRLACWHLLDGHVSLPAAARPALTLANCAPGCVRRCQGLHTPLQQQSRPAQPWPAAVVQHAPGPHQRRQHAGAEVRFAAHSMASVTPALCRSPRCCACWYRPARWPFTRRRVLRQPAVASTFPAGRCLPRGSLQPPGAFCALPPRLPWAPCLACQAHQLHAWLPAEHAVPAASAACVAAALRIAGAPCGRKAPQRSHPQRRLT